MFANFSFKSCNAKFSIAAICIGRLKIHTSLPFYYELRSYFILCINLCFSAKEEKFKLEAFQTQTQAASPFNKSLYRFFNHAF